ncbi:MAG: rhomboid family intramembrane serine protease [Fibrobacter sp.]|nr:rhomboid family intramembrane serine protease [Fibrobacter sp.]
MPRFMSPMIRRRPSAEPDAVDSAAEPAPSSATTSDAIEQPSATEPTAEPQTPPDVRISEGTFKQIRDESLVLLSQSISHRIERSEDGPFQIFVEPEKRRAAQFQIRLYHRENPPRNENPPLPLKFTLQPLWVLAVPVICTLLDFSGTVTQMNSAGIADAGKIMRGEWWRTITAMTLHGDERHLAGNLVSGYLALSLLHYRIPLAKLVPFLAVASAVANFFVAFTVQTNFRSLGYSSFVFAVIGCLAVIEFRLMPRETHGMLRRFAPLCGAASLAVFLGLGENADILGHLYGFIAGLLCGFIPKKKTLRWGAPTAVTDIFWAIAYYALFAIGWALAI